MSTNPQSTICSCTAELSPQLTILREEDAQASRNQFRKDVIRCFSSEIKSISSKYFYDDTGSELYASITDLDEYYLTRTEQEIFDTYAHQFVEQHFRPASADGPVNIVELGAGDGRKTKAILRALLDSGIEFEYIPVDISLKAMSSLFQAIQAAFVGESLKVHGIVGEYLECVEHVVSTRPGQRTAVLFIGSSIGNFKFAEAVEFLSAIKAKLTPRDFIFLGCDLVKDFETMRRAYSDSKGVTKKFNLNLLTRMNRELGTSFNEEQFEHLAFYNPRSGSMESYLIPTVPQRVTICAQSCSQKSGDGADELSFEVKAFEAIQTEWSHKFTMASISDLFRISGFDLTVKYIDKRDWFVDAVGYVPADE